MKSADQAGKGAMQIDDMRTLAALRDAAPAPDAAVRLSDRVLRAAVLNPDHSEAGRAAAAEALRARGRSVDPWDGSVMRFLKARDVAGALALFAVLGGLVMGVDVGGEPLRAVIAGLTVGAALVWFALFVVRRKVARVTLLRPAHQSGAPLRRFVGRELRCYGHVIALAAGAAPGGIQSASRYCAAAAHLRHRFLFNLRMLLSDSDGLALSASDAWRPLVLDMLVRSSDVLIVDLSGGPSWAWGALQKLGAAGRAVFVSDWPGLDGAEATLRDWGIVAPCFAYAPDGEIQRRAQFRAAMLGAMRAAHGMAA